MTELERQLSRALEQQERAFKQELNRTTEIYLENTEALNREFQAMLSKQQRIIEEQSSIIIRQMRLLQRYEDAARGLDLEKEPDDLNERLSRLEHIVSEQAKFSKEIAADLEALLGNT
jgi:hypothetical protein